MSSIAVFDSGFGGLTVLKQLQRVMPEEKYIFYGDSANAPYGDKTADELLALTSGVCRRILEQDRVKCFVIACNTTTSEAMGRLQQMFPEQRFVGIEPAVRWAVRENPGKNILVLGTTATIRGRRLQNQLRELEGRAEISLYAATGIVPYVEGQQADHEQFVSYLQEAMAPYREKTDCIVLGCTHFPFVRRELQACFDKEILFYDAAVHVAEETKALLEAEGLREGTAGSEGSVLFMNSDPDKIEKEKELLKTYE
ncbi:MAG: glutamate racemase [Lachnospiraceae bacterium]|jgi:glutamate racemase|nr:glutamate racemase [Lachnospiraceae bacterium]